MSAFQWSEPSAGVLTFHGELTVTDAAELGALLAETLARHDALEIDLLNVTMLDTAGLQLLIAVRRAGRAAGKSVTWLGYSAAVEEVIDLLNLRGELGEPAAVVWT
jgi:anti-sigma B factor antagonist